jgi:hypothetical protein
MCIITSLTSDQTHKAFADPSMYASKFRENGFCVLSGFFKPWAFELIKAEANRLFGKTNRKDVFIAETKTWRHMYTLGSNSIRDLSSIIPMLYESLELRALLQLISGQSLLIPKDANEQFVINALANKGDYHGAHRDAYAFAFNIMMDSLSDEDGGQLTIFDENHSNLEKTVGLQAGDAYLLRTDKFVHAVSTLRRDIRRLVINFAYMSDNDDCELSYSSDILYT